MRYDWSTGLIFKGGCYFDPSLGIWLALTPLVVVQSWRGWKKRRRRFPWHSLLLLCVCISGLLTACDGDNDGGVTACVDIPDIPTTAYGVKITTVYGPAVSIMAQEVTQEGTITNFRADWAVEFEVDRQGNSSDLKAGFIVQHITSVRKYTDSGGHRIDTTNEPLEYYEAWRVPAGQNVPSDDRQTPDETGLPFACDDNYHHKAHYQSDGYLKAVGVVKFYEYAGDTLPGFARHAVREADSLLSTYSKPCWWNDNGGIRREWVVEWDNFESWMEVSATNGTQSFNATEGQRP